MLYTVHVLLVSCFNSILCSQKHISPVLPVAWKDGFFAYFDTVFPLYFTAFALVALFYFLLCIKSEFPQFFNLRNRGKLLKAESGMTMNLWGFQKASCADVVFYFKVYFKLSVF